MARVSKDFEVVIVGTGRAGTHLARAFAESEVPVAMVSRRVKRRGRHAPPIFTVDHPQCPREAPFVLLAVPDSVIPEVARTMLDAGVVGPKTRVGHLSGALPSTILEPVIPEGQVFSAHPLTSFPPVMLMSILESGFYGVVVMVEAPHPTTVRAVTRLFSRAGATVAPLDRDRKPLYHAGAVVGTTFPFLNLLLCASILKECGVPEPYRVAGGLLDDVTENLQTARGLSGLTGPFARGDVGTIASNMQALLAVNEAVTELYRLQGRILADLLQESGQLPEETCEAIRKVLKT